MITNKWVLSETLVHFYRNLNKSIRVLKKNTFYCILSSVEHIEQKASFASNQLTNIGPI